jgi:hypothetical protein
VTRITGETLVIEVEKPQQCDYCGEIAELRPYGRNGACICFECGMKDEDETKRQFRRRLDEEAGE